MSGNSEGHLPGFLSNLPTVFIESEAQCFYEHSYGLHGSDAGGPPNAEGDGPPAEPVRAALGCRLGAATSPSGWHFQSEVSTIEPGVCAQRCDFFQNPGARCKLTACMRTVCLVPCGGAGRPKSSTKGASYRLVDSTSISRQINTTALGMRYWYLPSPESQSGAQACTCPVKTLIKPNII